jgi:hypothetical protein
MSVNLSQSSTPDNNTPISTLGFPVTSYQVFYYTDTSKPDNSDHRLSIVSYKQTDKMTKVGKKAPPAMAVSIPKPTILTIKPECLQKALEACYMDLQDIVIRSLIETQRDVQKLSLKDMHIKSTDISPSGIANYQSENSTSGHLSKQGVINWFKLNLEDNFTLALSNSMNYPDEPSNEQLELLTKAVNQHCELLSQLASPRTAFNERISSQLLKAVKLAAPDNTTQKLIDKLNSFLAPKEITIEMGL